MMRLSGEILEDLLRSNGLGWMIDRYGPADRAIPDYVALLDRVAEEYRSRYGGNFLFEPEALAIEWERNPHKVEAFLQLLRTDRSPAMLVMVWRVLVGLGSIRDVSMDYRVLEGFRLSFTLADQLAAGEKTLKTYESTDINDIDLLRHLGVAKVGGKPLFDGFYALRL